MGRVTAEQPYGPGALCARCGHFAARHNPSGCDTTDLVAAGVRSTPCPCPAMHWQGVDWPRPWLPAPAGLVAGDG